MAFKNQWLTELLREDIKSGKWKPGDRLPGEYELSEHYKVSRNTMRKAIKVLAMEGLLESNQGSGTFLADKHGLLRQKCHIAAIVLPRLDDNHRGFVKELENCLTLNGCSLEVAVTHGDWVAERTALLDLMARCVDGIFFIPCASGLGGINGDVCEELIDIGIPVIQLTDSFPTLNAPLVARDETAVGQHGAVFISERKHRRVGGIFIRDSYASQQAAMGFTRTLFDLSKRRDLAATPLIHWISYEESLEAPSLESPLCEAIDTWLKSGITAILCPNQGVYSHIKAVLDQGHAQGTLSSHVMVVALEPIVKQPKTPDPFDYAYSLFSIYYPWKSLAKDAVQVFNKVSEGGAKCSRGEGRLILPDMPLDRKEMRKRVSGQAAVKPAKDLKESEETTAAVAAETKSKTPIPEQTSLFDFGGTDTSDPED